MNNEYANLLNQATQVLQKGNFAEAEILFQKIITLFPRSADAFHLLGVTYSKQGRYQQAIEQINQAISFNQHPMYFFNLGESYRMNQQPLPAVENLKKASEIAPGFANIFFSLARAYLDLGDFSEAISNFQKTLNLQPNNFRALFNLGNLMLKLGDPTKAEDYYRQTIKINPEYAEAYNNLGLTLGNSKEAIKVFKQALLLKPDYSEARNNLFNVFKQRNEPQEIESFYQQTINDSTENFQTFLDLARIFSESENLERAIFYYQKALESEPKNWEIMNELGSIFLKNNQPEEAISFWQKAVSLNADFAQLYLNLATLYEKMSEPEAAKDNYRKALRLDPQNKRLAFYQEIIGKPVYQNQAEISLYQNQLLQTITGFQGTDFQLDFDSLHKENIRPPFTLIYQGMDDLKIREKFAALFKISPVKIKKNIGTKPQIGIIITPGHEGIITKLYRGILNRISLKEFSITLICQNGKANPIIAPSIRNPEINFLELPVTIKESVEKITDCGFDLLYYPEIGTDTTNYFLPFFKMAPIQINGWCWPVTSGIPQVDYFLSSELLETTESSSFFSEKLLRLPSLPVYYVRENLPIMIKNRSDYGLSEQQRIYFCNQNLFKLHPDLDLLTKEILERDPQAIYLLIESEDPLLTNKIKQRLEKNHGKNYSRIKFFPRLMSGPEYFDMLRLADVVIDSLHYTGGVNTISDAFICNTPFVTLPGKFQRGRYGYAMYTKMGISECLAKDAADYVNIALKIANERDYRQSLTKKIKERAPILFEDLNAVKEHEQIFLQLLAVKNDYFA